MELRGTGSERLLERNETGIPPAWEVLGWCDSKGLAEDQ